MACDECDALRALLKRCRSEAIDECIGRVSGVMQDPPAPWTPLEVHQALIDALRELKDGPPKTPARPTGAG